MNNDHDKTNAPIPPAADPRLTAFALGEMDAAALAAFESEIRDDPAAQAAVAEIRALAARLETALAAEPQPQDAPIAPAQIEDWRAAREAEARAARARARSEKPFRFPYFLIAGLATACFALVFFTSIKPDFDKKRLEKQHAAALAAMSAAAQSGTIVIDGKTYIAISMPAELPAPAVATPPDATHAPATIASAGVSATIANADSATWNANNPNSIGNINGSQLYTLGTSIASSFDDDSNHIGRTWVGPTYNFGGTAEKSSIALGVSVSGGGGAVHYNSFGSKASSWGAASLTDTVRVGDLDYKYAGFSPDGITGNNAIAGAVSGTLVDFSANRADIARRSAQRRQPPAPPGAESYARYADNDFLNVIENPLSTFSAGVDTASYTNIRRFLNNGRLPPPDAVRIEEMINYFASNHTPPAADNPAPFAATMEVASAPWNPAHRLVRIGIKARELDDDTRPPASLVFLIDISGSMDAPNRLPLVKESMRMLVHRLRPDDRIAIVTYASSINLALGSTPVSEKSKILDALDALRAGGGTNGGAGIQLAYEIARANFLKHGANRVILCTDGDFNIGITNRDELARLIEEKASSGVHLTALGFGMGNLKDSTLQLLASKGGGHHGYIDTRDEARRLLVEQTAGTLVTIASDVKLQVEFNPAQAASYRLVGYEKRLLAKEDFNNDKVDAGEIGAGHAVTALYEVIPANAPGATSGGAEDAPLRPAAPVAPPVDPLKYQVQTIVTTMPKLEFTSELLSLKIRFKHPGSDTSDKLEFTLEDKGASFAEASPDFKFTSSVAAFGMLLRDSPGKGLATYDRVLEWAGAGANAASPATAANTADMDRRAEFTDLVRRAKQIVAN